MKNQTSFYLAPLDAIWPPVLLLSISASIALLSYAVGWLVFTVLGTIGVLILIGDCFGRSKDYLNARRRFNEASDWSSRIEVVRRYRRAWCARVACEAAWKREHEALGGQRYFVSEIYHSLDYRWYHIFPDGTFTKNSPFLKTAFWVHLFTGKMKRDQKEASGPVLNPAE